MIEINWNYGGFMESDPGKAWITGYTINGRRVVKLDKSKCQGRRDDEVKLTKSQLELRLLQHESYKESGVFGVTVLRIAEA